MSTKLHALQRPDICRCCGIRLSVGTKAWWNSVDSSVECSHCRVRTVQVKRRPARRIGRVAKFSSDLETADAAERARRDCMLSVHLHTKLGQRAVVLDDRKLPATTGHIDHIVIAPSGVWVVVAHEYDGRVERRDVGGWFKMDKRLYVAGKDRTHLVDHVDRLVIGVENVLAKEGLGLVPVHAALCFVNSDWGRFAKPFSLNGVWVTWAQKLPELVLDWNAIPNAELDRLAQVVGAGLPAAA